MTKIRVDEQNYNNMIYKIFSNINILFLFSFDTTRNANSCTFKQQYLLNIFHEEDDRVF